MQPLLPPRRLNLPISSALDGLEVNTLLRRHLHLSGTVLRRVKWLEDGILLDGARVTTRAVVRTGQLLSVRLTPPARTSGMLPRPGPLDVVYEDADVIVVNKPVGMVVHPAPGHPDGTLVNALLYACGDSLSGINGALRPGIVHRIDRDTSGLLIAAKNDAAHLALSAQLQDHSLARTYEAVVIGNLREDEGTVDAPLARHPNDRKRMAVRPEGRHAVTHWTVLGRYPGYTHVECRLETGRTHQIRVHMAYLNHPVLGDPVYGGLRKGFPELAGQCLHARRLSFLHPRTGERVTVECPLPDYFTALLDKLSRLR